MLILSNDDKHVICSSEEVLDNFCNAFLAEAYDDDTRMAYKLYVDHFHEAFEADKRLTEMVQTKIAEDIVPLVLFDVCNWCDLDIFNFKAVSTIEDRKILKREELEFYEYCDICFGHIQGLMFKLIKAFDSK